MTSTAAPSVLSLGLNSHVLRRMVDTINMSQEILVRVSNDGTRASYNNLGLTELPDPLRNMTDLTSLNLAHNWLVRLPDWIGNLTNLTSLNLAHNRLSRLPDSLRNLTALTSLNLADNQLVRLPDWVGTLTALTSLDLADNLLAGLPDSLRNLTAVTSLDLGRNQLTELPEWLGDMSALATLNLAYNRLTELPEWLGNLLGLTDLYLSGNLLTGLPASLGNLTGLTSLHLANSQIVLSRMNQFAELPDPLRNLIALTRFDLSRNQLTKLPEWLGDFNTLASLNLADNRLTEVPTLVGRLTALTSLNLAHNRLTSLPSWLAGLLTSGLGIDLEGNRLLDPLPELVRRGADALATYLGSLEDAVKQYEAKLLLVGEGNVGKTSMVASLKGAAFVEGRPTTHGIEISPITLSGPSSTSDMTLRAWDFGGQQVYRVTHQFFFTRRALYAVVWHAREGAEQNLVEDWLRLIRLRVGNDARTIVVATHCEERLPDLDYRYLEQSFPGLLARQFRSRQPDRSGHLRTSGCDRSGSSAATADGATAQSTLGSGAR